MELQKIYREEDLFPREITQYEKREYGYLFYNEDNKESYDSNHAVIFKNKVDNINKVLKDIVEFYKEKKITPSIYQSITDDGYFEENGSLLSEYGFDYWFEEQRYMVLLEDNKINSNKDITVKLVNEWKDEYGVEIFVKSDEPWGIDVAKKALNNENTLFFVAFLDNKPIGMTYCHTTDGVCRVDYLLVAKEQRNKGVGRALINHFVNYCKNNNIDNCYLWPDGETAEKIYYEAGFRLVEIKQAGRAVYKKCNSLSYGEQNS